MCLSRIARAANQRTGKFCLFAVVLGLEKKLHLHVLVSTLQKDGTVVVHT